MDEDSRRLAMQPRAAALSALHPICQDRGYAPPRRQARRGACRRTALTRPSGGARAHQRPRARRQIDEDGAGAQERLSAGCLPQASGAGETNGEAARSLAWALAPAPRRG